MKCEVPNPRGLELILKSVMVQNGSVKVDYQVMEYQGYQNKYCLKCPKVLHIKAIKEVSLFYILNYILIIGTGTIVIPDILRW